MPEPPPLYSPDYTVIATGLAEMMPTKDAIELKVDSVLLVDHEHFATMVDYEPKDALYGTVGVDGVLRFTRKASHPNTNQKFYIQYTVLKYRYPPRPS